MEKIAVFRKGEKIYSVYKDTSFYLVKDIEKIEKLREIDENLYRRVLREQKIAAIVKNYKDRKYLIILENGTYIIADSLEILKDDEEFKEKFIEYSEVVECILDLFKKDCLVEVLKAYKNNRIASIVRVDLSRDVALYYAFKKGDILTFGYYGSLVSYYASFDDVWEFKTQILDDKQIVAILELARKCNKEFVTIFPKIRLIKDIAKNIEKLEVEKIIREKIGENKYVDTIVARFENVTVKLEYANKIVLEYVDSYNENIKHIIEISEDYENKDNYYISHSVLEKKEDDYETVNIFAIKIKKDKLHEITKIYEKIIEKSKDAKIEEI